MTTKEAIKILEYANKWRRGVDLLGKDLIERETPMPDPTKFGEAIDYAVDFMRKNIKNKQDIATLKDQVHNLSVRLSDLKNGGY